MTEKEDKDNATKNQEGEKAEGKDKKGKKEEEEPQLVRNPNPYNVPISQVERNHMVVRLVCCRECHQPGLPTTSSSESPPGRLVGDAE